MKEPATAGATPSGFHSSVRGLSTYEIKLVALVTMTLDHIGKNLYFLLPAWPQILTQLLGRCAAPLFIYAIVIGMEHTAHPWAYALRMYGASWLLLLGNAMVEAAVPTNAIGFYLPNDVFLTYTALIVLLIGLKALKEMIASRCACRMGSLAAVAALLISAAVLERLYPDSPLWMAALPWPLLRLDYGFLLLLGSIWFLCPGVKSRTAAYGAFCLIILGCTLLHGQGQEDLIRYLLVEDCQWAMILALPVVALYNGEKGPARKWLFYAYYPLHSYLLYLAGILLSGSAAW